MMTTISNNKFDIFNMMMMAIHTKWVIYGGRTLQIDQIKSVHNRLSMNYWCPWPFIFYVATFICYLHITQHTTPAILYSHFCIFLLPLLSSLIQPLFCNFINDVPMILFGIWWSTKNLLHIIYLTWNQYIFEMKIYIFFPWCMVYRHYCTV